LPSDRDPHASEVDTLLSRPPAHLVEEIPVRIPHPRDQIITRETEAFVELRGRVARLIRNGG
jgi:NitT/TauT family transport system ATP-binding protein